MEGVEQSADVEQPADVAPSADRAGRVRVTPARALWIATAQVKGAPSPGLRGLSPATGGGAVLPTFAPGATVFEAPRAGNGPAWNRLPEATAPRVDARFGRAHQPWRVLSFQRPVNRRASTNPRG